MTETGRGMAGKGCGSMAEFGVVVFPGSNCDEDCVRAIRGLGHGCESVWHGETSLDGIDCVVIPGGFSYGDYLRAGVMASFSPVMEAVKRFAGEGKPVVGICNGFQILAECGLLEGAFVRNRSLRFVCEWTYVRVENDQTPFTASLKRGDVLRIPIANREGAFFCDGGRLNDLNNGGRVVFRYCSENGEVSESSNPNGSVSNIAGVCSEGGNVMGMMPHPERCCDEFIGGTDGAAVFESAARWAERAEF